MYSNTILLEKDQFIFGTDYNTLSETNDFSSKLGKLIQFARERYDFDNVPTQHQELLSDMKLTDDETPTLLQDGYIVYEDKFSLELAQITHPDGEITTDVRAFLKSTSGQYEILEVSTNDEVVAVGHSDQITTHDFSLQNIGWLCYETCCTFGGLNWQHCGSNCGQQAGSDYGGGTPINDTDECCAAHDACWDIYGSYTCSCEENFFNCLTGLSETGTWRIRQYARYTRNRAC
ncbi:hypothetical protein [Shouchella lehensis]|uniref:Phospholipase A2 domain-containing protein n=1 Tax=Shouchella lehensis TaxID=300825 RepID=A0A4Y7WEU0_9BACI|nr:hypothetical protein [Shouchella lehensis]MBG9785031.1 hypothetical protein [Shouchella lehensis]TES46455.1 hypothetical protein E2L03_17310 [Shouchella lehensis]